MVSKYHSYLFKNKIYQKFFDFCRQPLISRFCRHCRHLFCSPDAILLLKNHSYIIRKHIFRLKTPSFLCKVTKSKQNLLQYFKTIVRSYSKVAKVYSKIVLMKSSDNYFIFLPAFYPIMCLMKAPKIFLK